MKLVEGEGQDFYDGRWREYHKEAHVAFGGGSALSRLEFDRPTLIWLGGL